MDSSNKDPQSLRLYKKASRAWKDEVLDNIVNLTHESARKLVNVLLVSYEMRKKRTNKINVYKKMRLSLNDVAKQDQKDLDIFEKIFYNIFKVDLKVYASNLEIKEKHLPEVLKQYKIGNRETAELVRKGIKIKQNG